MAIRSDSLKRFVYVVPGLPKRENIDQLLKTIEQTCKIVEERVDLKPEFVNTKVSLPIKLTLPPGILLVKPKHGGDTIIDYNPGVWRNPDPKALVRLSKFADATLSVELKRFNRIFDCRLQTNREKCSVLVEAGVLSGRERPERIACLEQISALLHLPIKFPAPGSSTDSIPEHHDQLNVTVSSLEKEARSSELRCELTQKTYAVVLEELLAQSKGKLNCWRVENIDLVPFTKLVSLVNKIGFPGRKTEIEYTWRLGSYKDFPSLTEMATRNDYGSVAQSLFEFESGKNKRGQLDVGADKKGGFKVWFSFDTNEAQLEFTQLTGIKLKQWN